MAFEKVKIKKLQEEIVKLTTEKKALGEQIESLKTAKDSNDPQSQNEDKLLFKKAVQGMIYMHKKSKEGKNFDMSKLSDDDRKKYLELHDAFMKLMLKYNINFMKAQSIIESENGRKFITEFMETFFDELAVPLDSAQISKVEQMLQDMGIDSKKTDDPTLSNLEKTVLRWKLSEKFNVENILSQIQLEKLNEFTNGRPLTETILVTGTKKGSTSFGGSDLRSAAESLANSWKSDLKLSDQENELAKRYAELYVSEYLKMKRIIASEMGDEFKLAYWGRSTPFPPNTSPDVIKKYEEDIQKIKKSPDYAKKQSKVDLMHLELQLKYQKELVNVLGPFKADTIKNSDPSIYMFTGLE